MTMCEGTHIFLSYSHRDAEIATELASRLEDAGLSSFVAERDISATQQWEPRIRDELHAARCVLILLTPRSRDSIWVAIETGAAWVLKKDIVPVTMFVEANDLNEPMRRYQARPAETNAQVTTLIQELQRKLLPNQAEKTETPHGITMTKGEVFGDRGDWDSLQKIGDWQIDENSRMFQGEGEHKYLLSHFTYGQRPFRVSARLRFKSLRPLNDVAAVNAGIVFGWRSVGDVRRYYNLMFTGTQLLLELVGARGGPVFQDFQHIDEGVPFVLESGHYYNLDLSVDKRTLIVKIDGKVTYSIAFSEEPVGRVGLRPWRSRIESERFEVHDND